MSKDQHKLCHKKQDLSWGLCDPVGKGGTRVSGQYPYVKSQAGAFKSDTGPKQHFKNPQAQSHAGPSKNQRK